MTRTLLSAPKKQAQPHSPRYGKHLACPPTSSKPQARPPKVPRLSEASPTNRRCRTSQVGATLLLAPQLSPPLAHPPLTPPTAPPQSSQSKPPPPFPKTRSPPPRQTQIHPQRLRRKNHHHTLIQRRPIQRHRRPRQDHKACHPIRNPPATYSRTPQKLSRNSITPQINAR